MAKAKKSTEIEVVQPKRNIAPAKVADYGSLIEQIDSIRVETVYNASQVILEGKLQIGRILSDYGDFGITITDLVNYVAHDTGINERDLWYCYKFAENYDQISRLPLFDTKVISWNKVKKMLADPNKAKKVCEHEHIESIHICVDCNAKIRDI